MDFGLSKTGVCVDRQLLESLADGEAHDSDVVMETEAAPTDTAAAEAVEAAYQQLVIAIEKQPLNRPVFYQALAQCRTEQPEAELEIAVSRFVQFKSGTLDQHTVIMSMVKAGGLQMIEYDNEGGLICRDKGEGSGSSKLPQANSGDHIGEMPEKEIEVSRRGFLTTALGLRYLDEQSPDRRIGELLASMPGRNDIYMKLLESIVQDKHTYKFIESLLSDDLAAMKDEVVAHIGIKPSVFVDKMERAGGIIWDDGWAITDAGRRMLEAYHSN